MPRYIDRTDAITAPYGYIYLIAKGVGKGYPAFDGNVHRTIADAKAFLEEMADEFSEYQRLSDSLVLMSATKEERDLWESTR